MFNRINSIGITLVLSQLGLVMFTPPAWASEYSSCVYSYQSQGYSPNHVDNRCRKLSNGSDDEFRVCVDNYIAGGGYSANRIVNQCKKLSNGSPDEYRVCLKAYESDGGYSPNTTRSLCQKFK